MRNDIIHSPDGASKKASLTLRGVPHSTNGNIPNAENTTHATEAIPKKNAVFYH